MCFVQNTNKLRDRKDNTCLTYDIYTDLLFMSFSLNPKHMSFIKVHALICPKHEKNVCKTYCALFCGIVFNKCKYQIVF